MMNENEIINVDLFDLVKLKNIAAIREYSGNINIRHEGNTVLHYILNNIKTVKVSGNDTVETNPDNLNIEDDNDAAKSFALADDIDRELIKLLLEKGALVDILNNDDICPLQIAAEEGLTEVVKLFLEPRPNVKIHFEPSEDKSL